MDQVTPQNDDGNPTQDADDEACPLLGVKRTSLNPLTNVR